MIRPNTPSEFHSLQSAGSQLSELEPPLERMTGRKTQVEPNAVYRRVACRPNKAHTATARRIARRYDATFNEGSGFDIQTDRLTVEVETTATMCDAFQRLQQLPGPVYVALTNKDGVKEALHASQGSRVGVMDPHGNIVRESLCEQT